MDTSQNISQVLKLHISRAIVVWASHVSHLNTHNHTADKNGYIKLPGFKIVQTDELKSPSLIAE